MSTVSGVKHDSYKPMANLVIQGFPRALLEVSKVATYGATKYTPNGWKEVDNGETRYRDALMRHYLEEPINPNDLETGFAQMAHIVWNGLAVLELMLMKKELAASQTVDSSKVWYSDQSEVK
jgi:hypothetical protein